ncbi:MAG: NADP-binding protein [Mesoaciditoga sp.]|uniref:2,4-diaminopentanoate dehydrogenase n=1 Tax=Athalassotoga sp. TaxID=2022597 RepID=UPI000CC35200|nr:MAG: NADP-binding protein [Mesoaciditoga sp.]PMP79692.1 MAG: NADP-binding protein [Mesoaciditoga sp.]HEU24358.1 NADP-binding protein [Mesoaciditoga lauensis]
MYRIMVWGMGAMGSGIVKNILQKRDLELTGVIETFRKDLAGKPLKSLGIESDIQISSNPQKAISDLDPDLIVIATASFVPVVFPMIKLAVENSVNVITLAEEMAYPWIDYPELSHRMDSMAKKHNVSILGTGINPGFVLDTLILSLTGVCLNVKKIKAQRINDLSPFGNEVMRTQGVGTSVEEFYEGIKNGKIVGHIGFRQSIYMIADALGWKIEKIEEEREPIVSKVYRETPYVKVKPGYVAGCKHIGRGFVNGEAKIELIHPQQIHPELEEIKTGDFIQIEGDPNISLEIKPEIPGGKGTIAMATNMIPKVIESKPGLMTMKDLQIPYGIINATR